MGIFSKISVETPAGSLTFAEEMADIKKAFKVAHENANTLHGRMEQEIQLKQSKIEELNKEIEGINITKKEAS